jgi:hypothetical protein
MVNCYGAYQKPIYSNIWFINDTTFIYLISNYIAFYNMTRKTTSYLGINKNISEITAFYVCKKVAKNVKAKGAPPVIAEDGEEDEEDSHVLAYAESA